MNQRPSDPMTANKLVLFDIFRNMKQKCKFGDHRIQLKITFIQFKNCMQKTENRMQSHFLFCPPQPSLARP